MPQFEGFYLLISYQGKLLTNFIHQKLLFNEVATRAIYTTACTSLCHTVSLTPCCLKISLKLNYQEFSMAIEAFQNILFLWSTGNKGCRGKNKDYTKQFCGAKMCFQIIFTSMFSSGRKYPQSSQCPFSMVYVLQTSSGCQ